MRNREGGITLIALVTTIIVLLILAGVSISMITDKGSAIKESKEQAAQAERESIIEKIEADLYSERVKTGKVPQIETLIKIINDNYGTVNEEENTFVTTNGNYTIQLTEIIGWEDIYEQDGLIMHLDAINNTGEGDEQHSTSTNTWKDLSGNGNDGTIYNINNTEDSGWKDNYLSLDGIDDYVSKRGITVDGENGTVEIVAKYISGSYMFRSDASGMRTYICSNYTVKGEPYMNIFFNGNLYNNLSSRVLKWYTVDATSSFVNYYNNVKSEEKNYTSTNDGTYVAIGSFLATNPDQLAKMNVYSVRVYNKPLTDEEVKHNYEIDRRRFNF